MEIPLTSEQAAWLGARVAAGEFASVEQAVLSLLDQSMARSDDAEDDLAWAKPLVDEALASVARSEAIPIDDHREHMAALLARLGGR